MPEADGAGVGVRGVAVGDPAAAEHLGRGRQVDVELEPYDRLVGTLLLHFQVVSPSRQTAFHVHSSIAQGRPPDARMS